MTTEELKTNGYAIKFDGVDQSRLYKVLRELSPLTECEDPSDGANFVKGYFSYLHTDRYKYTMLNKYIGDKSIPLSEVQLMSEVKPKMYEFSNHKDFSRFTTNELLVDFHTFGCTKVCYRYDVRNDTNPKRIDSYKFVREIQTDPNAHKKAELQKQLDNIKKQIDEL
jgi:hypothetical protein